MLNLLPSGFESVEGLKIYNRDFAQVRDLTFALVCQPRTSTNSKNLPRSSRERLRAQPWCRRVLAGVPIETPEGVRDLQSIALPLFLIWSRRRSTKPWPCLQPAKIQERLHRLHEEIEAGSPRPQIELGLDPLGVIAPALKPFAGNAAIEEDQPLTSPDRTMRVFLTVTNQPGIGAFDCQKLMQRVKAFQQRRTKAGMAARCRFWSPAARLMSRRFR